MACEKYSSLIADEALGGLNPVRGAELREHLAQCIACREESDRAKTISALVDRGIEALVAGEPSPQFAARLRARIAEVPASSRFDWRVWIPVVCGGLAFAALLMVVMTRTPQKIARGTAPVAQSLPNPEVQVPTNMGRGATEASQMLTHTKYRVAHLRQPEVLVPPGQFAAVVEFANAVNAGRIDGKQIVAAQQKSEQPLEIEAIQVSPLNVPQLDDGSDYPDGSGGY